MPYQRTDAEVLQAHSDTQKDEIKKCLPATVTAVHPDRQTVDVQISVMNPLVDEYGNVTYEKIGSISDVPIGVMRGGGAFIWLPVAVGDSVLLVFSDLSLDTWRAGQANGNPVNPGWVGKHTLDSAFAIPCCAPDAKFFTDPNNDPTKIIIGKDGSAAQIRISPTHIELGNAVSDAVALASKVASNNSAIESFISGPLATLVLALVPVTGVASGAQAAFATAVASFTLQAVGSTLIKAQ